MAPLVVGSENASAISNPSGHSLSEKPSLDEAERRDPKGLYKKARSGEIPNFTGISSPYEQPKSSNIILNTEKNSVSESVQIILDYLDL